MFYVYVCVCLGRMTKGMRLARGVQVPDSAARNYNQNITFNKSKSNPKNSPFEGGDWRL